MVGELNKVAELLVTLRCSCDRAPRTMGVVVYGNCTRGQGELVHSTHESVSELMRKDMAWLNAPTF